MSYQFNFGPVFAAFDSLLLGAWVTVQLSVAAMVLGLIVGILGAAAKLFGGRILRVVVDVYIEVIRNTPFLVQIFFIFFALPLVGLRLNPTQAAILALLVNVGAYAIEIIRAGIESISRGQVEAGMALGLGRIHVLRYVILKPALRAVYPALTSQFILLMLSSSVVSTISANDLTAVANDIQSATFSSFEVYLVITVIYLVLAMGLTVVFRQIERITFSYPTAR
ncbi:MAG: polar amino acid transporter, inner rane subunit [Devosia sp.]|nr:polar amino acid transporter, inner rane subunit [Devosia sp.]MDB5770824.1 polar amino acid transporter, inner rane subunit [Burkholderia sp.]